MRTSNPVLNPAGDWDPVYPGSWRRCGWCNCLCTPPPSQAQSWRGSPHASATVLARRAPAPGRRPASAPRAPAGAAPRAPSRVYTNLFARDWGRSSSQPAPGSWLGDPGDRTHPAIVASWGARLPGRRARSPAVPGAQTPARPRRPWRSHKRAQAHAAQLPGLRTSALSSGGDGGRRPEPWARSGAGSGRGAGERAPGLHMLTRAARGQRPASAGS